MKTKTIIIFLVIVIIVLIGHYAYSYLFPKQNYSGTPSQTINITYENFVEILSKNSLIKDIPENAEVLIKFYNFNSGERSFEKSFIVKEGKLQETSQESAEVEIWLHSKYISSLTNKNLCTTFQKANQEGDMSIETKLSAVTLAWKFKSMAKYKDCF